MCAGIGFFMRSMSSHEQKDGMIRFHFSAHVGSGHHE